MKKIKQGGGNMFKGITKRIFSLTLVAMMLFSMLPGVSMMTYAATVQLSVNGLSASNDGGEWTANGNSVIGSATGRSGGCSSDSAGTGSLTLTNNKSTDALLSFDYELSLNGGSVQIDGNGVNTKGHFEKNIAPNSSVIIKITSKAGTNTTSVTLSNISLIVEKDVTTTFIPAENGSYTVDGTAVTTETVKNQISTKAYNVEAKPANGYKFLTWYSVSGNKYLGTSSKASLMFEEEQTVTAKFVPNSAPIFETAGARFSDLNEAVKFAQDNKANKITLVSDGTLPAGNYTIPKEITLLVPFDDAGTMYTTTPANVNTSYVRPTPFRTLTMAAGANINVNGAISVSAKHAAAPGGQYYGGTPSGKVGFIKMNSGSSISVGSGGALYAWGYVIGSGKVDINSGAKVYENFQIADFRGGSATSNLASGPIFPFSQYYIQNVEVPMTIHSGATEQVYSSLNAMSSAHSTSIEFIGNNGMFKLANGSKLTKTYDGNKDRLIFDLDGDAELKNLTVDVAFATVNSSNFNLPINDNITLNINSGTTTINQSVALQPGVEVSISRGATIKVAEGKKLYVYDGDQWGKYACNATFVPAQYPKIDENEGRYNRTAADLKDVVVDVNGTIELDGAMYTTESGADITSSLGNGKVVFNNAAGTETTTQQYENNKANVTIPVTSAKLHNADNSYTETADAKAGDTFIYTNGKWAKPKAGKVTVTFDANEGEGKMDAQEVESGTEATLNDNTFTREGYNFDGWCTSADGKGTKYADKAAVTLTEDTTLYAQWAKQTFTVTWTNEDGTVLETDEKVEYGTTPKYDGDEPTKATDDQYTYKFKGWTPEVSAVKADVTYKAEFEPTVRKYTITWKNEDGTVLDTAEVAYGEIPAYTGKAPEKESDAENHYTFAGWVEDIVPVAGDATYTAKFTSELNNYSVTWKNWDGTVLKEDKEVAYGTTPKYDGAEPTREGNDQFTYKFKGWSPEVDAVKGDITYTAVFEENTNKYTITWICNGETLKSEEVAYGEMPVYAGADPAKEADAQYKYVFKGWTPEVTTVTGDATYDAEFTAETKTYVITWVDEAGTELYKDEVAYGATPEFKGEEPTKEADDTYHYTAKVDPEVEAVKGDTIYTFKFEAELHNFEEEFTAPTETTVGTIVKTCKDCKKVVKEEINETGLYIHGDDTFYLDENHHAVKGLVRVVSGDVINYYYFGDDCKAVKATEEKNHYVVENTNGLGLVAGINYEFDGSGVIKHFDEYPNGIYEADGSKYYCVDGVVIANGLMKIDGDYYYARTSTGQFVLDRKYYVSKTNDLKPAGYYQFDKDGKLVVEETPAVKNGIVAEDNSLYYYKDGKRTGAGLIKIDNDYYYVRTSNGEVIHGRKYWITATNDLLPAGPYEFDENGKLINPPATEPVETPDVKDGVVAERGSLYYYKDGKITGAGLVKIDDDYYYVRTSNGEVIHGRSYWVTLTNGLVEAKTYQFDETGKMLNPPA